MTMMVALACWIALGMALAYLVSMPQFGMSLLGMDTATQRRQQELARENVEAGLVDPDEDAVAARVAEVARALPSSGLITGVAVAASVVGGAAITLWLGESVLAVVLSVAAAAVACGVGLTVLFGMTLARLSEQDPAQAQTATRAAGEADEAAAQTDTVAPPAPSGKNPAGGRVTDDPVAG